MLPYLRLVRAGTLFSPAADIIAGLCLVAQPWSTDAVRLMFASVCLYAAGMILNDHADRAIDAEVRPERPIPRGDIGANTALGLGILALVLCLVLSPIPIYHGIMAALVLGYDYFVKANAFAGALVMGSLRAMNLLAPAFWVNRVEDLRLVFVAGAGYAVYIIAVTLLGILEDAKFVKRKAVLGLASAPPLTAALVIYGATPHPWPASAIAFVLAALFFLRMRGREFDQGGIRGLMMWLLIGTMAYTGLLALACGQTLAAVTIFAMVLPARWIGRYISLT